MRINDQFDENWFWNVLKIDETLMKQRRTLNFMEVDETWWATTQVDDNRLTLKLMNTD